MDVFTYHTLMMGNTKLGRFYRVLSLYDEAIKSNAKVNYSDLTEILQTIQAQVIVLLGGCYWSESNCYHFFHPTL